MVSCMTESLIDKDFRNWLRGALAVLFTRDGLIDFVESEITVHQRDLLKDVSKLKRLPSGTTCSSCTTADVLDCPSPGFCGKGKKCNAHDPTVSIGKPKCPLDLCTSLRDAIRNEHRLEVPSWKNTDARGWCTDAYQLAKCFLPPVGYSDKASFAETDFDGVITVLINNRRFEIKMSTDFSKKTNICTEARKAGREIRHSATHHMGDKELVSYIDVFKQLLSDPKYLVNDAKANDAVEKLKQLKTNTMTIHADDITRVLNDNLNSTFDDHQKALINEIQEHFKEHQTDSIEAIDKIIQEFSDQGTEKLDAQTEKENYERISENRQENEDFHVRTETGNNEIIIQTEEEKKDFNEPIQNEKTKLSAHVGEKKEESIAHVEKEQNEHNVQHVEKKEKNDAHAKKVRDEQVVETIENKEELKSENITKERAEQRKEEVDGCDKQFLEESNRAADHHTENIDDPLLKDLKEDIITYYRECESVIPAAPLVDFLSVPIEELYDLPPMVAYTNSYIGQGKDIKEMPKITISQLFAKNKIRYRKIYISANAGFGKTSLSQNLTMTWCQAHAPLTSLTQHYKDEDLAAMKYFDLLFLLRLKDYHNNPENNPQCNVDDFIMQMVSEKLSRNKRYKETFVQRILHDKTCLIILDGLDEWAHPSRCRREPAVPHNNHPLTCTVLTTTRDWKIGTIGLSDNDIDRRVEILMLNSASLNLLENKAVGILEKRNLNPEKKRITDFNKEVKTFKIGDILYIPYILLQLICLFFDGLPIGKSKCEIHSNITELKKKDLPIIDLQSNDNAPVPNCMKENETCKRYFTLLMKLGKLAFYTLFSEEKESSLIIDRRIVTQYMTEQEIEFCLKVGLLCQTKDSSKISEKRYQVFFQHKSVQEFFSAIYITSNWRNKSVKLSILEACPSISSILERENLFVFVCGMNPEVYTCISGEFQKKVDRDGVTDRYRSDIDSVKFRSSSDSDHVYDFVFETMKSYQSMQVQCMEESNRNSNRCSIHLQDILYRVRDSEESALKAIINYNKGHVKSLLLSDRKSEFFFQLLDSGVLTSIETLRVVECGKKPFWLSDILTKSADTLKCLTLSGYNETTLSGYKERVYSVSDICMTEIKLTCLQSFHLAHFKMTHNTLELLYGHISKITTLTHIKLQTIICSDHKTSYRDCDLTLGLHLLNHLKIVILEEFKMSRDSWRVLLLSVGDLPQRVRVTLRRCGGPTDWQWKTIEKEIKSTSTLSLLQACKFVILSGDWCASLTLKNRVQ